MNLARRAQATRAGLLAAMQEVACSPAPAWPADEPCFPCRGSAGGGRCVGGNRLGRLSWHRAVTADRKGSCMAVAAGEADGGKDGGHWGCSV